MRGIRRGGRAASAALAVLTLAACAETPMGPTVNVMPGPGKSFEVFAADQNFCRYFAEQQVQGQAQNANNRAVGSAVIGTLVGAGLGAATGAAFGNAGAGAAIGAGTGVIGGSAVGGSMSNNAQGNIQIQYNNAYAQCMFAKGHQVPGFIPAYGAPRAW